MNAAWGRWPRITIGAPRDAVMQWSVPEGAPATISPPPGPLLPQARTESCGCSVEPRSIEALDAHIGVDFEPQLVHDSGRSAWQPTRALTPFELAVQARSRALVVHTA